jgi:AH receptor-interacting protein
VLKYEPDNVKAIYRRAKAHVGAWNPEKAKADYMRAFELDQALHVTINKELKQLQDDIKAHDIEDKLRYQKLF